jgi:hypothetical protein
MLFIIKKGVAILSFVYVSLSCGNLEINIDSDVSDNGGSSTGSSGTNNSSVDYGNTPISGTSSFHAVRSNNGVAIVGKRSGKPWLSVSNKSGQQTIDRDYDSDFADVTSSFGNGLPAEGSLNGSAVAPAADGGYIIGTDVTPRHHSYGFSFIFKVDASGNLQWKKELNYSSGGTRVIHFVNDIKETQNGNIVAVGYTSGDAGNQMKGQGFMIMLNSQGSILWIKRYGTSQCVFDSLNSVVEDSNNNLITIGKREKPCPGYQCFHGYACGDVYFIKTDAAGNSIKEKKIETSYSTQGTKLEMLVDGNIIAGGTIKEGKRQPVNSAMWKFNTAGDVLWEWKGTAKKEGNVYFQERVNSLIISADGNSATGTGYIEQSNGNGYTDFIVWTVNTANGQTDWTKRYEMPASQYAYSILMLNPNTYLLVGPKHYLKIKSSDGTMLESLK